MPGSAFEYKAFISYSHRDTKWAQWLLTALETYRMPVDTPRPAGARPLRGVGRIFRDRDEAGAAADLKDEIQRALLSSEHLIIIASPNSARSAYVQAEIEAFAEANGTRDVPGAILTLIVDGEPNVSAAGGDDPRECFPPALRGGLRKLDGSPLEPLAADARPIGDGKTRALAKLVSGLTGIRYDALMRRDLRRQQRDRLLVVAVTTAVLVIAGLVATVVVSGNVEQANLRAAREEAERDARTVAAVNDAERARRLLENGNRTGAIALARSSLAPSDKLPFIPQAYSVLYGAMFQGGGRANLELGSTGIAGITTKLLANGDFISVGGKVSVWSVDGGVGFTREDLSSDGFVTAAPDRTAIFLKNFPSTGVLRYRPGTRRWDLLDDFQAVIDSEALSDTPDAYVAIDSDTLAGCNDETLAVISFPETGDGPGRNEVSKDLGYACTVLARTQRDTLLVADWDGKVREYSFDGEPTGALFDTSDISPRWARDYGDVVIIGTIGHVYAFERAEQQIIDSFAETTFPKSISPSGRRMLETGASLDTDGPTVHDLLTRSKRSISCQLCDSIGFLDDETVLMLAEDHRAVLKFNADTGRQEETLFTFEQRVDEAELLEDGKTILGIRPVSVSAAVTVGQTPRDVTVVAGPGDFLVHAGFAGPTTIVTQVAHGSSIPMQTVLHLYEAQPRGNEIVSPDLIEPGGVSVVERLPNGLFSTFDGDAIFQTAGPFRIFDAATGKLVFRKELKAVPRPFGEGRFLLLADQTEFGVFDTKGRSYAPLDTGAGIDVTTTWSATSNALVVIVDKNVKVFSLGETGAHLRNTFALATPPLVACLADDAKALYLYDFSQEQPFLSRVDAYSGKEDARVTFEIPADDDSDLVDLLFDSSMNSDHPDRVLRCTADTAQIRAETYRLAATWSPPATSVTIGSLEDDASRTFDDPASDTAPTAEQLSTADLVFSDVDAILLGKDTGAPLVRVSPEQSRIASAAWVPGANMVAVGLDNGRLQAWNATATSATMIDVVAHARPIEQIDVSPDNRLLLSADTGGTVKLWPLLSVDDLLAEGP